MGRQWLHAKRAIVNLKKGQAVGKMVKEITVAAKLGGGDPGANARLHAALDKARKVNVTRDVIERAIAKGTGAGGEKMVMDHIAFEGYAPHKVPVIVEAYTDNHQRTAPEIRLLFRRGVLGAGGSNKFLFDHVGIVEAYTNDLVVSAILFFLTTWKKIYNYGITPLKQEQILIWKNAFAVRMGLISGIFVMALPKKTSRETL